MLLLVKYVMIVSFFLLVGAGLSRGVFGQLAVSEQVEVVEDGAGLFFTPGNIAVARNIFQVAQEVCAIQLDLPADKQKCGNLPAKMLPFQVKNTLQASVSLMLHFVENTFLSLRYLRGFYVYTLCKLLI